MAELRERLDTWTAAGLLDVDQAAAIEAFEATGPGHAAAATQPRRGALAEAIGYVGAALALGAVAALLGRLWEDLATGGRVTLVALLTVVLAGAALGMRRASTPALVRLTATLWSAATLSFAWLVGIIAAEVAELGPELVGASVGLALVLGGVPVLVRRPSIPAQLVVLAGAVTTAVSSLTLPALAPDAFWYGLTVWALGVAWLLLAQGGWVRPPVAGMVLGGGLALVATQVAAVGSSRLAGLLLAVVTAGALVGVALLVDGLHHLVLGALGLFVGVPQLVFELFGDTISAPAALLVVGLLLVLLAVGLGRASREVRRGGEREPLAAPPTAA